MPSQGLQGAHTVSAAAIKAGGLEQEGGADGEQPANDGCASRPRSSPLP